ncbi:unnamed protein product, partial [Closterium sp. NIES-53]
GVPPPRSCPLLLLLLRPTSVVSSRSVLRLPLVGAVTLAGARGARVLVGLAGAVAVVVEAVEGVVVVVGVVAEVEVSAAAVEAVAVAAKAEGAEAEEVAEEAEAVAELVAALHRGVAPVVVSASSSSVVVSPPPPSSFVSGTLGVSAVEVLVPAPTFSVPATALDQGVDQFTPASQRVTHCTCASTGRHLATFTRRPGSSLYTLSTESPSVPASSQVARLRGGGAGPCTYVLRTGDRA